MLRREGLRLVVGGCWRRILTEDGTIFADHPLIVVVMCEIVSRCGERVIAPLCLEASRVGGRGNSRLRVRRLEPGGLVAPFLLHLRSLLGFSSPCPRLLKGKEFRSHIFVPVLQALLKVYSPRCRKY